MRPLHHTGSAESFKVIREWLHRCLTQHDCCSPLVAATVDPQPPQRLIDVNAFGISCLDVRLADIQKVGPLPKYIALSYCWGKNTRQDHLVTTDRLESYMHRIPYGSLPRTIKDAILITRRLQVQYLWVDSLCILQNSKDDWLAESAKMGFIYGCARLTISADSSPDSQGGCFNKQSRNSVLDIQKDELIEITSTLKCGQISRLYLDNWERTFSSSKVFNSKFAAEINRGALAQRAWTYQERALSPRIVHYTSRQLYWECQRDFLSEENFKTWENFLCTVPRLTANPSLVGLGSPGIDGSVDIVVNWYCEMIEQHFSHRELTHFSDRLPALAGLASLMGEQVKSPYLVGLWLQNIAFGLGWRRANTEEVVLRGSSHLSPSWSWISHQFPVKWDHLAEYRTQERKEGRYHPQLLTEVENYHVELKGKNPFGEVLGGLIKASGKIKQGYVLKEVVNKCCRRFLVIDGEKMEFVYLDYDDDDDVDRVLNSVWCLPLYRYRGGSGLGLLLQQRSSSELIFERKGVAKYITLRLFEDTRTDTITIV
jgi:hypothetical protein